MVEVDISIYSVSLYRLNNSPSSFELYNEMVYGEPHPPSNSTEIVPLFKQYVAMLSIENPSSVIEILSDGSSISYTNVSEH